MELQVEMRHVNLHKCKTAQALKSLPVDMSLPSQNHLDDCSHIMTASQKTKQVIKQQWSTYTDKL